MKREKKTKQVKQEPLRQLAVFYHAMGGEGPHEPAPGTVKPKQPARRWSLIDGEEKNRRAPEQFQIPSELPRRNVVIGVRVRIGLEGRTSESELFWVHVVSKQGAEENPYFIGMVLNSLVYSGDHGIRKGDLIDFGKQHILDIVPK